MDRRSYVITICMIVMSTLFTIDGYNQNLEINSDKFVHTDTPTMLSLLKDRKLINQSYQDFKREFWPMLQESGLLKERVNTVELKYSDLFVNSTRVNQSLSKGYIELIEKHFPQEYWAEFQWRRDGLKASELANIISSYQLETNNKTSIDSKYPNVVNPANSQSALSDKFVNWKQYRDEFYKTLVNDGVLDASNKISGISWQKDRVVVNGNIITGEDFIKYRTIKEKYYPKGYE